MRGYPLEHHLRGLAIWSIPADAGLPLKRSRLASRWGVYPRGCGATRVAVERRATLKGLSPRMRGYHYASAFKAQAERSIPADAGLPQPNRFQHWRFGVYPRGCGATAVRERWT